MVKISQKFDKKNFELYEVFMYNLFVEKLQEVRTFF